MRRPPAAPQTEAGLDHATHPVETAHLDAKAQGEIDGGGLGMHRARNRRRFEKPHEVVVQIIDEPRLRLARREDAMGASKASRSVR